MFDRISLTIGFIIFLLGSIGDISTTSYGYSNGFAEMSPFVRSLLENYGALLGAVLSKLTAFVLITILAVLTALYYQQKNNEEYKQASKNIYRDILVIAGLVYLFATINNVIVLLGLF